MKYDCLIVDDEQVLADSTAEYLNWFHVKTAAVYTAEQCLAFFQNHTADLVLLDITLGNESGFALCQTLRKKTDIPILFISARTSDDDQIIALNIGGDDYVQKPYSLSVLLAKVKAVLKRYGQSVHPVYTDDHLHINLQTKQILVQDMPVKLTALEFKLLAYLIEHRDRVVSKQELFEQIWGTRFTGDGTLNVHIRKIREVIERMPSQPKYIQTVWGDGYRFCGESNET